MKWEGRGLCKNTSTHTCTHARARARAHTHTHTLSFSLSLSPPPPQKARARACVCVGGGWGGLCTCVCVCVCVCIALASQYSIRSANGTYAEVKTCKWRAFDPRKLYMISNNNSRCEWSAYREIRGVEELERLARSGIMTKDALLPSVARKRDAYGEWG